MASGGYYGDQSMRYGGGYSSPAAPRATTFHLCVFLATAALLGGTSLYSRCESAVEALVDQVRVAVVLSPLLLLLAVQYWAATGRGGGGGGRGWAAPRTTPLLVAAGDYQPAASSWYDSRSQQRDGGGAPSSPWGVAMVLALVLLLVSYQSCFQDLWFPLVRRRR